MPIQIQQDADINLRVRWGGNPPHQLDLCLGRERIAFLPEKFKQLSYREAMMIFNEWNRQKRMLKGPLSRDEVRKILEINEE